MLDEVAATWWVAAWPCHMWWRWLYRARSGCGTVTVRAYPLRTRSSRGCSQRLRPLTARAPQTVACVCRSNAHATDRGRSSRHRRMGRSGRDGLGSLANRHRHLRETHGSHERAGGQHPLCRLRRQLRPARRPHGARRTRRRGRALRASAPWPRPGGALHPARVRVRVRAAGGKHDRRDDRQQHGCQRPRASLHRSSSSEGTNFGAKSIRDSVTSGDGERLAVHSYWSAPTGDGRPSSVSSPLVSTCKRMGSALRSSPGTSPCGAGNGW